MLRFWFKMKRHQYRVGDEIVAAFFAYCPACQVPHRFIVEYDSQPGEVFEWDGKMGRPTFSPAVRYERGPVEIDGEPLKCHAYLREGVWEYQDDCTHELAGQKVDMPGFPENYRV